MSISSGHIRDQSRKLSEIATKFGRFLALPNFRGRDFQKLYARYEPCIATDRLEKFHEDIPTSPEVIEVLTLNFKRNFTFLTITILGDSPDPVEMCDSKAWLIFSACRNLRAQHPLRTEILCPEKCPLGWVSMHLYNFFVRWPKFTRFLLSNVERHVVDQPLFRFSICRLIPEIFAIKVESC